MPTTLASRTSRSLPVTVFAVASYVVFLAVLAYSIGFFAGVVVPKSIDDGPRGSALLAAVVDLSLLAAFAVQHTVMARRGFKQALRRMMPAASERAIFVLAASLLLALTFACWRPLDGVVWRVDGLAAIAVWTAYVLGWALAIGSTYLISHADLFGLRQAWQQHRYRAPAFTERGLYRLVRHPLMAGFLVVFWSAPVMTEGHLLFALASTGYIAVGVAFEERDLVRDHGAAYLDYRARVPAVLPFGRRS